MSLLIKAAEDIKALAKKFKPLFEAAEALEQIGSLDNAAKEAVAKKELAYKEIAEVNLSIEKSKKELDLCKDEVASVEKKAELIVEYAHHKAQEINKEAVIASNKIVSEANAYLKDSIAKKALNEALSKSIDLEIEGKKQELESINLKISDLKAKISSFIK